MKLALPIAAALAVTVYLGWEHIKAMFSGPLTPREPGQDDDLEAIADAARERRVGLPTDDEIDQYMAEWGRQMRGRP